MSDSIEKAMAKCDALKDELQGLLDTATQMRDAAGIKPDVDANEIRDLHANIHDRMVSDRVDDVTRAELKERHTSMTRPVELAGQIKASESVADHVALMLDDLHATVVNSVNAAGAVLSAK